MNLPLKTLARKALKTQTPLVLNKTDVADLKKRLTSWCAGEEALTLTWREEPRQDVRSLCKLGTHRYYGRSAWLILTDQNKLFINFQYHWRNGADALPVGSIEELQEYCRLLREAATKKLGEQAKHKKVQKLQGAAIVARVRDWAREHHFAFTANQRKQSIELLLRFDEKHIVELSIPFAQFDEMLTQIETSLPLLRDLVRAGIATHLRPGYAKYLRYGDWEDPNAGEQDATA